MSEAYLQYCRYIFDCKGIYNLANMQVFLEESEANLLYLIMIKKCNVYGNIY